MYIHGPRSLTTRLDSSSLVLSLTLPSGRHPMSVVRLRVTEGRIPCCTRSLRRYWGRPVVLRGGRFEGRRGICPPERTGTRDRTSGRTRRQRTQEDNRAAPSPTLNVPPWSGEREGGGFEVPRVDTMELFNSTQRAWSTDSDAFRDLRVTSNDNLSTTKTMYPNTDRLARPPTYVPTRSKVSSRVGVTTR